MSFEREVVDRLSRIEAMAESTHEEVASIKRAVFGYNGQLPGLMTRLDRIEQTEGRRKWAVRATLLALLGVVLEAASRLIG